MKKTLCRISCNCPFNQKAAFARGNSSTGGLSGAKSNSSKRRHFDLRQMLRIEDGMELEAAKIAAGRELAFAKITG